VDKALKIIQQRGPKKSGSATTDSGGRVDFVQVQNWGTGKREDLGNLEVAEPVQSYVSGDSFYEFIARQLQSLQAEGALEVARPAGTPPPPPFSDWLFSEAHYLQYLVDQYSIHSALEESLQKAIQSAQQIISTTGGGADDESIVQKCNLLGLKQELARSKAIVQDIENIKATSSSDAAQKELTGNPTPNAAAYVQLLRQLAVKCERAETVEEVHTSLLKLSAHLFVTLLTLLTSGNRIGATAAEKLDLFSRNAVQTFKEYPNTEVSPLKMFRTGVDELGPVLNPVQQDIFMDELPSAMRRTGVLLESLARSK
jgi:hypothetical protein